MRVRAILGALALLGLGGVVGVLLPAGVEGERGAAPGPRGLRMEREAVPAEPEQPAEAAGMEDPRLARELYLARRLPPGETEIPLARYLAAQGRRRAMVHKAGAWTFLGPGNIGGRTRALVVDPVRPRTMYAGGVDGGVWRTSDGGATWTPLTDLLPNLAVSSLALDPGNRRVLYAGTGEGFGNADAVPGAGIFKTADAGATWTQLPATAGPDFTFVNRLVVSPSDGSRVYAATGAGLLRSLDGGASWSLLLSPGVQGGCLDLALRPFPGAAAGDDALFVSCGTFVQATVYRNLHANKVGHWVPVLSAPGMGRTSLAISPSSPNVVYALAASNVAGPGGLYLQGLLALYRSDAGGTPGSFAARVQNTDPPGLGTALLSSVRFAFQHDCGAIAQDIWSGRGWYDNTLAVDPVDPDRVWVGGVDLFRSDDGGRTWGIANYWWAGEAGATAGFAHADQHALVFHPRYDGQANRVLFVAGDGGIYRTADALAPLATGPGAPCRPTSSAFTWTSLNHGYGVTQFYHGAPFPDGSSWLGGSQDTGVILGSAAAGPEGWRNLLGSDGGRVAVDPSNPNVLYAESFFLSLQKSTDGGATFAPSVLGLAGSFNVLVPFLIDPSVPQRLWLAGTSVFRSDDGAGHWHAVSSVVPGTALENFSALAVSNPGGSGPPRLLAGSNGGQILANNGSAALADQTSGPATPWPVTKPRSGFVSSLTFSPGSALIAYATYSTFGGTHVWRTQDAGATWQGIDGSRDPSTLLPDLPVHCLAVDPRHPERLYIGTDLGVFVSLDTGETWAAMDAGFANVVTESLTIAPGPDGAPALFAFTHGRGAWRMALPD